MWWGTNYLVFPYLHFPSSFPRLPSFPFSSISSLTLPSPPLPFPLLLEVVPLIAATGSGGALELPQRVRAPTPNAIW